MSKNDNMIADRYMIVTSLGEGGMADVYLAMDTILNREVAVKVLRGELSEDPVTLLRFLREASAVSKLHHPNVVEVYDVGEYDGKNYIVMEYVRGRTLKQMILQRGALPKEEAVEVMKQLVSAVNHAHEKNIIHRDIKPQNVLVKDDGTVKITDFGIALAHDAIQLTQSDAVLGSAHYIAPETTKGEVATVQTDIYALGIVFYELLSGSVPFKGDNPIQVAMKHLREDVPSIRELNPTIPQSIENIITKATAKNRMNRYSSAKDMLYDLDMCLRPEFSNVDPVNWNEEDGSHTVVLDRVSDLETKDDTVKMEPNNVKQIKIKDRKQVDSIANEKKDRKKKIIIISIVSVAMVLLALFGALHLMGVFNDSDPSTEVELVKVPNLKNISLIEAKEELEAIGLKLGDVSEEATDDIDEGLVISQSVQKGKQVKKGKKIDVVISSGKYFVVDDYSGLSLNVAQSMLNHSGINIQVEEQESDSVSEGTIISQSLLYQGDKVKPGENATIKFIVAKKPKTKKEMFTLEDYYGQNYKVVQAALTNKGIAVKLVEIPMTADEMAKQGLTENAICGQNYSAGTTFDLSQSNSVTLNYCVLSQDGATDKGE